MNIKINKTVTIKNKKAYFDYAFIETYVAGIVLTGTEIKSIRQGKASLVDTFCYVQDNGVWMKNSYVATYDKQGYCSHEERRVRKLLLNLKEIRKIASEAPGITIIPIKMFINDRGLCKVEIAVCKGKKEFDKRESIKERDTSRELAAVMKRYR